MPSLADTLRPSSDKQTNALRSRLDGLGAEGADAIQQIREINGSFPGWRWIEEVVEGDDEGDEDEDTSTRYVHIWVKLAPGVEAKDVVFRAKKGATNVVGLTVGGEVVFDDSMRLNSDVDGHDSEWTIEADDRRGGCRSVHITLTRCKAVKYYDWGRPFRNLKDLEAKKAPLLRKAAFGDGVSVAPAPTALRSSCARASAFDACCWRNACSAALRTPISRAMDAVSARWSIEIFETPKTGSVHQLFMAIAGFSDRKPSSKKASNLPRQQNITRK